MIVGHKEDGWNAWCFRCNLPGFVPHPAPSLEERIARLKQVNEADREAQADTRPPMPAEFDPTAWPAEARVWLYKAGFSNDRIQELGFYWTPRMKRVVLPVIVDGKLAYWQARGFDPDRPKYINPPVDRPIYKIGTGPILVLTEDILSAAKVGAVTEAWSLLGTDANEEIINDIMRAGRPVRVWLDPDGAGVKGRRKLVPKLRAYGLDAVSVQTERDPKLHSSEEIRSVLNLH